MTQNRSLFILIFILSFTVVPNVAAEQVDDKFGLFQSYLNRSNSELNTHNYINADGLLDTAMQLAVDLNDKLSIALVNMQLGIAKKYLGDFAKSLEHFLVAEASFKKLKAWKYLTLCNIEIAEFYRKTGKYPDAKLRLYEAHSIYERENLKDTLILIKFYNRSAAVYNESDSQHRLSIGQSKIALELAKQIGDKNLMAVSMNELGFSYKNLKMIDSSEYYYLEAEKLWISVGNYFDALHAMDNRAMLYGHSNFKKDLLVPIYKKIIHFSDSMELRYPLTEAYWYLYNTYIHAGDSGAAVGYLFLYHESRLQEVIQVSDYNLHNIREKYQTEKISIQYDEVSEALTISSDDLSNKKKEQLYLVSLIVVLVATLIIIVVLLYKLRNSNKQLVEKNLEKDSLIQEIHHRVKNNLQFISSLVNMQLKSSPNQEESKTLMHASRRINAMALVHEMLYNQSDKGGISIKQYLEELIDSFQDLVNTDENRVNFELAILEEEFNVTDAISLGMITSELISNSMKHAFSGIEQPVVKLVLEKNSQNEYLFYVKDNGKGFESKPKNKGTLGLRLVDIFSRQLNGDYTISGNEGLEYRLIFLRK